MGAALLVATIALVLVTAAYAVFTARMVSEMKRSRLLAVRPSLVLDIKMRSGTWGEIAVRNVGPGAAIDLDLSISFPPTEDCRSWKAHVLAAAESRTFMPPQVNGKINMEDLAQAGVRVVLTGATQDVYGAEHIVNEEIDLDRWWRLAVESDERLPSDPQEVMAEALRDIRDSLKSIAEGSATGR